MNSLVSPEIYDLLKKVVNNGNMENYTIHVHSSNKKGEGYLGEICYVSLNDKTNGSSMDLAVKQAFSEDKLRTFHPLRRYYLNEIHFYTEIWPRFQEIQINISKEPFNKIPKCFVTSSEYKNEKIVLENLKLQNFQLYEKSQPFDDKHMTYILKEYGKFHAISFAYKLLNPQEFYQITKNLEDFCGYLVNIHFFRNFTQYVLDVSLKSLDSENDAEAKEKFKVYVANWLKMFGVKNDYHGDYTVVLHGDCWSNNMMFKYSEDKQLTDLKLLDFQFAKVGTPISDLSYCIYSGGSKEIFDKLDHYLKIYHDSLLATLEGFGVGSRDVYPFDELKREWKEYCQVGFTMGLFIWRASKLIYQYKTVDFTNMMDNDESLVEGFKAAKHDEKAFRTLSRDLIVHLVENGFL